MGPTEGVPCPGSYSVSEVFEGGSTWMPGHRLHLKMLILPDPVSSPLPRCLGVPGLVSSMGVRGPFLSVGALCLIINTFSTIGSGRRQAVWLQGGGEKAC